jgi:hypothetical protein
MNFKSVFYPAIGGLGLIVGFAIMGRFTWSLLFVAVIASLFASIALNVILRRRTRQLNHR